MQSQSTIITPNLKSFITPNNRERSRHQQHSRWSAPFFTLWRALRPVSPPPPQVLEAVLLPLYRRLKVLLRREDAALLHHVYTALDGLESATRQMLFPPAPRTLQKRIVVLDPPS